MIPVALKNREPASETDRERLGRFALPREVVDAWSISNGGHGVFNGAYIQLFSVEEICNTNERYAEFTSNVVFLGSDGGGLAFGYSRDQKSFVMIHFIDIGDEVPNILGNTLEESLLAFTDHISSLSGGEV